MTKKTNSTNDLPAGKRPRGRPRKETILPDPSELGPHRQAAFESSMEVVADAVATAAMEMWSDEMALDYVRSFGLDILKEARDLNIHKNILRGGSGNPDADKNKIAVAKEGANMVIGSVKQRTDMLDRLSNSTVRAKYLKLKNELTQAQIDALQPKIGDDDEHDAVTIFEVVGADHKVDDDGDE